MRFKGNLFLYLSLGVLALVIATILIDVLILTIACFAVVAVYCVVTIIYLLTPEYKVKKIIKQDTENEEQ